MQERDGEGMGQGTDVVGCQGLDQVLAFLHDCDVDVHCDQLVDVFMELEKADDAELSAADVYDLQEWLQIYKQLVILGLKAD